MFVCKYVTFSGQPLSHFVMAIGKRRGPPMARRRANQRRRIVPVPRKVIAPVTYTCKKRFWLEQWVPSTAAVNGYWRYYAFTINQLPDFAGYNAMFDTFKINAIKVEFHPRFDSFAGNDTTDTVAPGITNQQGTRLSLLVDSKSSLTPVGAYGSNTYNDFLQQGTPRTSMGIRTATVYFKPQVSETAGVGVNGALRRRAPWMQLDAGQSVAHAGFHAFAWDPNFNGSFGNAFDVMVTYYVSFRGMR